MPLPPANPPEPSAPVPPLQPAAAAESAEPGASSQNASAQPAGVQLVSAKLTRPTEVTGPAGPDPTRYGDWERAGRCIDF